MSIDLELIRKAYKSVDKIMNKLMNDLEHGLKLYITWNTEYTFCRCWDCNGPFVGHRPEKCRNQWEIYDDEIFEIYIENVESL